MTYKEETVEFPEDYGLVDLLEQLEKQTKKFFENLISYKQRPSYTRFEPIVDGLDDIASSINQTIVFILNTDDSTQDEKVTLIADVLKNDDKKRVDFLNTIFKPSEEYEFHEGYPDDEDLVEELNLLLDQELENEQTASFILQDHCENMFCDLDGLTTHPYVMRRMARIERQKSIGRNVLRVGTTATAVTMGVVAGELILRHI